MTTTVDVASPREPTVGRNLTFLRQMTHLRRLAENWQNPSVTQGSTTQQIPVVSQRPRCAVSASSVHWDPRVELASRKQMLVLQPTHDARAHEWRRRVLWVTPVDQSPYIEVKLPHQSTHATQTDPQNDPPIVVSPLPQPIFTMQTPQFAAGPIVQFQQPPSRSWNYGSMQNPWYNMRQQDSPRYTYRPRRWRGGRRGHCFRGHYTY